jgi:hypothetical protein
MVSHYNPVMNVDEVSKCLRIPKPILYKMCARSKSPLFVNSLTFLGQGIPNAHKRNGRLKGTLQPTSSGTGKDMAYVDDIEWH